MEGNRIEGVVSVNMKKIKAAEKVNALVAENYRTEGDAKHYDDGHRMIDTCKTGDNVFLLGRPGDYDARRRERMEQINQARAKRADSALRLKNTRERMKAEGTLTAERNKSIAASRKLRSDTVDTLGIVVQPSAEFINALPRPEQERFFKDALDAMMGEPGWFGRIDTAVIHFDENTPHMQCLASTLNGETLASEAKQIMGNKSRMSERQTLLANMMQGKGWGVSRGMKRVDNPEYRNFKSEMDALGIKVNRHNDAALMEEWARLREERDRLDGKGRSLDAQEKLLGERERRLSERDRRLSERTSMAHELETSLRAREKALVAEKDAFWAEAKEFDAEQVKWRMEQNTALRGMEDKERDLELREAMLERRKHNLDARESDLNCREINLQALDGRLSAEEEKALKTQNTALQAIARLNRVIGEVRHMSEMQLELVRQTFTADRPLEAKDLETLEDALGRLEEGLGLGDGLSR